MAVTKGVSYRKREMKSKTVIILGADYSKIPVIERAHKPGFKVICVDKNPKAPGLSTSDYPLPKISTHDPEEIIKARKDNRSFCGFVLAAGTNRDEVFGKLSVANKTIRFNTA